MPGCQTREENAADLAAEEFEHGADTELSAEQLDDKYNPNGDGEHPVHTRGAWVDEAFNHHTLRGYWDWVGSELEQDT